MRKEIGELLKGRGISFIENIRKKLDEKASAEFEIVKISVANDMISESIKLGSTYKDGDTLFWLSDDLKTIYQKSVYSKRWSKGPWTSMSASLDLPDHAIQTGKNIPEPK